MTTSSEQPPGEFVNADQIAVLTGIPASTWRYFVMTGRGPQSFKIGRRRVWRRATVEAWLAEREAEAAG